jgi:hypothetical protein
MGYADKSANQFFIALFLGVRSPDRKDEVLACGKASFFMGQAYRHFRFSARNCLVFRAARSRPPQSRNTLL